MNLNVNRNVRSTSGLVPSCPPANRRRGDSRGFTLVEMLVAMAVTLLLMAALGKGFAYIGESIRDSRVQVELTNDLRDVTNRLQEDLTRCTVPLQPSRDEHEPDGYFLYYEGPVTDATSSLFLSVNDPKNPAPESRYGDFDDYLAFTAVATGDSWFTGMVPRFILDQKTAALAGNSSYTPDPATMNDPVMIRSKYAEIVYFASPEYEAGLQYVDVDANGLPDRLRIHRRVLLIRPDLNITTGAQPPRLPRLNAGSDWLLGMAALHQQCDLSLRRVSTNGIPDAAGLVAANSLADLAKPHNRFAHVRVPGGTVGLGNEYTSMPILALSPPATVLTVVGQTVAPVDASSAVVTPANWSGFLRPEFVLSGARIGEDVLVPSAVGFDLKVFDPLAPVITTSQGVVVSSGDPGFRQALSAVPDPPAVSGVIQGDFVDLMYPVLAGGSLRGWQPRMPDRLTAQDAGLTRPVELAPLLTPFSGLVGFGNPANSYQPSLYRSGKVLVAGNIQIFQPTWDTFTHHYERDGLQQGLGRWRVADFGTPDAGANGLDNSGGGSETSPPFLASPEAIKVSVRLEHRLNRQVRQLSIVHRDTK
jgi:prepilin-type N-terminal cleavage/methylation domain-containing protein